MRVLRFRADLTRQRPAVDLWSFDHTEAYPIGEVIIPGLQLPVRLSRDGRKIEGTLPEGRNYLLQEEKVRAFCAG